MDLDIKTGKVPDRYKSNISSIYTISLHSIENDWNDFSQYPKGGYLNDIWEYNKDTNTWRNLTETLSCPDIPGAKADEIVCSLYWPEGRAGHASVVYNGEIYIHGGYRTFFPYPSTSGRGAGRGTMTIREGGFTPYPTHPYYLQDMWKLNLTSGKWEEIFPLEGNMPPPPRTEHVMVAANDSFILFGGYVTNFYFDDTWQYNISANRWFEQKEFVHAMYPVSCTDDLEDRKLEHSGLYGPHIPKKPYVEDDGYIFNKEKHYGSTKYSVSAEPTREKNLDPRFVTQSRRQAPGWDGCRDRYDNRKDLPQELQWSHPSQRAGHMSSYFSDSGQVFIYGGFGFTRESLYQTDSTLNATSLGDLWQYDISNCPKNCSTHGNCHYGKCRCDDGYYGVDCSNSSCPGSFCYYNENNQQEICNHCCFSGFEHTDNDTFVENIQKYPCTHDNLHYSNGVCDGFGKCLCRPGFVGDDCSIRDCGRNCSAHGYCSIEFPNSRCMCDEGWYGKYCELRKFYF
jgi:hypothetical protein